VDANNFVELYKKVKKKDLEHEMIRHFNLSAQDVIPNVDRLYESKIARIVDDLNA
jgi:hypothetical protein